MLWTYSIQRFLRSDHSGYFRALFFPFFHRNATTEARASCPWKKKEKKNVGQGIRVPGNKVGLSGHERKADCRGERRVKRRSTGNRILRPADQTSHCPSMSERIHLWLDEWAVIAATIRPFSRNVKVWNNYNGRVKLSTHSTLFSLGRSSCLQFPHKLEEQHRSNISL